MVRKDIEKSVRAEGKEIEELDKLKCLKITREEMTKRLMVG